MFGSIIYVGDINGLPIQEGNFCRNICFRFACTKCPQSFLACREAHFSLFTLHTTSTFFFSRALRHSRSTFNPHAPSFILFAFFFSWYVVHVPQSAWLQNRGNPRRWKDHTFVFALGQEWIIHIFLSIQELFKNFSRKLRANLRKLWNFLWATHWFNLPLWASRSMI